MAGNCSVGLWEQSDSVVLWCVSGDAKARWLCFNPAQPTKICDLLVSWPRRKTTLAG